MLLEFAPLVVLAAASTALAGNNMEIVGFPEYVNDVSTHNDIMDRLLAWCKQAGYRKNALDGRYTPQDTQFTLYCCVNDDRATDTRQNLDGWWFHAFRISSCGL
ncbi:hypothetical protein E4U54_003661 [Claviceps lovelessii]|nr:hypothetical protein E4U54_003661 [Claviceps lovelessii]